MTLLHDLTLAFISGWLGYLIADFFNMLKLKKINKRLKEILDKIEVDL